jgi:hypothetical protein
MRYSWSSAPMRYSPNAPQLELSPNALQPQCATAGAQPQCATAPVRYSWSSAPMRYSSWSANHTLCQVRLGEGQVAGVHTRWGQPYMSGRALNPNSCKGAAALALLNPKP